MRKLVDGYVGDAEGEPGPMLQCRQKAVGGVCQKQVSGTRRFSAEVPAGAFRGGPGGGAGELDSTLTDPLSL